jgi:hypothetical protein
LGLIAIVIIYTINKLWKLLMIKRKKVVH